MDRTRFTLSALWTARISHSAWVLVSGAGGGMGSFAVQIATHYGAEVTAVDSRRKLGILMSYPKKKDLTRM